MAMTGLTFVPMKTAQTILVTSYEPFTFANGVRLARVTWEITSDGWGFTTRRCVAVREVAS